MTEIISSNTNLITNYFTPTPRNDIVDLTLPLPDPVIDLTAPSRPDPRPRGKARRIKPCRTKLPIEKFTIDTNTFPPHE